MLNKFRITLLIILLNGLPVLSQQTIFNVPSADVTEKGHLFVLQEAQFNPTNPDAYFNGTTFTDIGIGHNTEVGATLFNVGAPATGNMSIGAGFKSAIPIPILKEKFPQREIKLTVGSEILFGVQGNDVGNWTYTHLSGRLPKLNTRLTAGISYGTKQVFGKETTSFIGGIEQPITKKFTLLGDWFSGSEHWAGYCILGGSYAFPKKTTLFVGFQLPNTPSVGRPGFVVELGKIF